MTKKKVKEKDMDKAYWSATLKLLIIILGVWAIVSFLLSIVFVEALNTVKLGGYPLGFWFAQQGSIYVFVALIFIYVMVINRIDKKYDVQEDEDQEDKKEAKGKS